MEMTFEESVIIDMYNEGDSLEEITSYMGLSKKRVCDILRKWGYHSSFVPYSDNNIRTYRSFVKRWEEAVGMVRPYLDR